MHALHDVVQAGYARYLGMSSCWAWQCMYCRSFSIFNSWHSNGPFQSRLCKVRPLLSFKLVLNYHHADYAITNKLTPFISMQNHYSLVYREEEREMFPTLKVGARSVPFTIHLTQIYSQMFGVGSIPWSPLGRGILTRPITEQTKRTGTDS